MLRRLGTLPVLAVSGTIMVVTHLVIHTFFVPGTGGTLLDFQLTGAAAQDALMLIKSRPNAVGIHLYLSAGVDMLYPLAYGIFVAGLCFRYGAPRGGLYALPILAAAGFDIAENVVQVIALTGDPEILALKTVLTPAKFGFAAIGSLIAIWLWARTTFGGRPLDDFFHFPGHRSGR
ncbi:MAG: hypothetical protein AAFR33_08230 [Pseudomonadota bacterium]